MGAVTARGAVITLLVLAAAPAEAHHTRATARAGPTSGLDRLGPAAALDKPHVAATLDYQLGVFGRMLEGRARLAEAPQVTLHTVRTSLAASFATQTRLRLEVPVGVVVSASPGEPRETTSGLADASFEVRQDLSRLWSKVAPQLGLALTAGVVLPSGRYADRPAFSVTDLAGDLEGGLDVTTYNTRASLGAGTWALAVGLSPSLRLSPRWLVQADLQIVQPLTDTPDEIRWGRDFVAQVSLHFSAISERLGLRAIVDHQWHARDDIPDLDDETGARVRREVGGRHSLGLGLSLDARLSARLACGLWGRLPVWQYAGGVQLVETVSTQLGCQYTTGL